MCNASITDDIKGMMELADPVFARNELNDMIHYICTGHTLDDDDDDDTLHMHWAHS